MKPIKLQLAGLNSYRTQQAVDFEALGADGLFGIFGPTGSGKSSLLDAITLALYGGVERASNNTRGIIHQLEKTLEVSFEFELGADRYRVERRYDRNPKDPDAALAKQARLRKLAPAGEEVLASKPQEVTAKVEAILGIGKDEFSRAVVLPQGKFDQFLRLTGADRAAMLEHLFNLEQYGEELVAKVKNEAAVCTERLQRIEGEQQGLGDCSEAAVHQAVVDLKVTNDEFSGAQQAFETVEKSYKEAEAVRELFLKRKTAMAKLTELEQEHETMAEKQSRLNTAERAEPLRELIARRNDLHHKIALESVSHQKKSGSHADAARKQEEAAQALQMAEHEYQEQLPVLQEKKAQYQGAREKRTKLNDLHRSIEEKQAELARLREQISHAAPEIAACKKRWNDARIALESLQRERAKFMVDPDEKERIEQALTVLVRLEESETRCRESNDNYAKRKSQNDSRWADIVRKVRQMAPEKTVAVGDDLEEYAKSLLNRFEKEVEEARRAQQQALLANSAAELAKELQGGEPCPVCGSREHPLPARAIAAIEQTEQAVNAAENRLREARDWEGQLLRSWHDWSTNESLVQEARETAERNETDLRRVAAEFEKVRGAHERGQLRIRKQELAEFDKRVHALDQNGEALRKTQDELNEKLPKLTDAFQRDKISEASVQADLTHLQSQCQEIVEELHQITGGRELDELIRELIQTHERLQKAAGNAKARETETRAALETVAREIAALEATLTANRSELAGIDQRLTDGLKKAGLANLDAAEAVLLETAARQFIRQELEQYRQEVAVARSESDQLDQQINNRRFDEKSYEELKARREALFQEVERLKTATALARNRVEEFGKKQERWNELQKQRAAAAQRKSLAEDLGSLLRGRKFVSFLAQEHLRDMTLEASYQLGRLTGQRYALELAKDKDCEFVIRDDYHGGNRRLINSLSGGEVFMTSLALALALSSKIQLRGKYPLGFFFLDEGFGSLDEEKLDKVMNALEKLHDRNRMVGVISHVKEMKERLPRYLEVLPAGEDGSGSRIRG
jgi:exonuclease SbcC